MALTFPSGPSNGQVYTDTVTGNRYIYDSSKSIWKFASNNVGMTVGTAPPPTTAVAPGAMWYNTNTGRTFILYDDGDSKQWVENVPAVGSFDSSTVAGFANVAAILAVAPAYTTANAGFAKANTALQNTSGTFAGNLTVTGNVVFSDATSIATSSSLGIRNRIINGSMDIWQRGNTVTYLSAGTPYLADRWSGACGYQNARHQRVAVTSPPTELKSKYALRVSSSTTSQAAGGTRIVAGQLIESINCYDLVGQTISLSFWIKFSDATVSSSTATPYADFVASIGAFGSTTDSSYTTTVPTTLTNVVSLTNGSLPTTWTKYTATYTVPAGTNNLEVRFYFNGLGNTASADTVYYDITQIQLEPGSVATPFERRPIGIELGLCQRYYFKLFYVSQNDQKRGACGYGGNATGLIDTAIVPVEMRALATVTLSNTAWQYYSGAGAWTSTTASIYRNMYGISGGTVAAEIGMTTDANGGVRLLRNANADVYIIFDIEL